MKLVLETPLNPLFNISYGGFILVFDWWKLYIEYYISWCFGHFGNCMYILALWEKQINWTLQLSLSILFSLSRNLGYFSLFTPHPGKNAVKLHSSKNKMLQVHLDVIRRNFMVLTRFYVLNFRHMISLGSTCKKSPLQSYLYSGLYAIVDVR